MRIVHTADWHVGRIWKSLDRRAEMEAVLDHLAQFLEHERIDLLLMAGDVFETGSPSAEAERLVFSFFKRIGKAGIPSVVIAGNHDNPARLDAWGTLAELVGVRTLGKPRRASKGGLIEVHTPCGETALVAAVPFAPVRTWVSALDLAADETFVRAQYAEMFKRAVHDLSTGFRTNAVNLVMAHTHLDGAVFCESERRVHLGTDWAATPQSLPATAQYVALGHIHKPQKIEAGPSPTWYCGSPLQLDFGEAGQEKVFLVIETKPGRPAKAEPIAYEGGKPLAQHRLTLDELEQQQDTLKQAGWLRITVPLTEPDTDLARKVRALLPNAISIQADLPEKSPTPTDRPAAGAAPFELYRAFHQRTHGDPPDDEVAVGFESLYDEEREHDAATTSDR